MEKFVTGNPFENHVCSDCGCDLSGVVQRDLNDTPYFKAYCDCGEVTVSMLPLVLE